ncbi:methionyl-tRNA formyltransferase [Myxococcota bacterium]|nr:methionyl-tRNA formyltransferase [Myxococcota bacterium]
MRVVFMGTPALALPTLEALLSRPDEFDVVGVVTQPDRPAGRGQSLRSPPVAALATRLGLPLAQPKGVRGPSFLGTLAGWAPDVAVVVAFGRILPRTVLDLPRLGCVNVHASLLPAYRGAGPIQRAILDGHPVTGVTTMWMDEGLDTGPMLLRAEEAIGAGDTAASLGERLGHLGARVLVETLRAIRCGGVVPEPQDPSRASLAPLLQKEDGRLDFRRPAQELERVVRGTWPWPGAFTTLGSRVLKVHRAAVPPGLAPPGTEPGTVLAVGEQGLDVACGEGVLRLAELQPEGRRPMAASAFANGHPDLLGSRLGA